MKNNILVSIIIPVYNCEKYIQSCIDSAINQTLKNIQIIIIDDGSTDNSYKIIKKYQQLDSRILLIKQKNHGLSYSRNIGIKRALGKYIFFLDSDDTIERKSLQMLYNKAKKTNTLIVIGEYKKTYFDNNTINIYKNTLSNDSALDVLVGNIQIPACNKLYHKSLFIDNDLYFANKLYHEDNLFTLKAIYFAKNKISILNKIIYNYNYRQGSISSSFGKKHINDMIQIFDLSYKFAKQQDIYKNKKIEFLVFVFELIFYYLKKHKPNKTNSFLFEILFLELKNKKYINKNLLNRYKKAYPIPFFLFICCIFAHKITAWDKMLTFKERKNLSSFNIYENNYHALFIPYLKKHNIKSIIAYGANEIYLNLEAHLEKAGIKVLDIIDKKAESQILHINSKKALTLNQCLCKYNYENILILSFNYAYEIKQEIKKFMKQNQKKFTIIHIGNILQLSSSKKWN